MKKKFMVYLPLVIMAIGFILILWGAIKIDQFPGFKEMRKAAFHSVHVQYITGLVLFILGWLISTFHKYK